jgi:hypothetical protein
LVEWCWQENQSSWRRTSAILCTKFTVSDPRSNLDLHDERLATKCLSRGPVVLKAEIHVGNM